MDKWVSWSANLNDNPGWKGKITDVIIIVCFIFFMTSMCEFSCGVELKELKFSFGNNDGGVI